MEAIRTAVPTTYTPEEYLALDASAPRGKRWEYDGAEVWALAGARPGHNQLKENIARALGNRLAPRGCRVMSSDQRVRLDDKYVYPDVVAFCEAGNYTDENPPSLLNPALIVEVLSYSTVERDRTWKLDAYQAVPSVREIWFAWPDCVRLDQHIRTAEEWRVMSYRDLDATLHSDQFALEISLGALYEFVLE